MAALPERLDLNDLERMATEGSRALFMVVEQHRDSWRLILSAASDPAVAQRQRKGRQLVVQRVSQLMEPWLALRGVEDAERRLPALVELFMSIAEGMSRALMDGIGEGNAEDLGAYVGQLGLAAFREA